eukprot:scaffold24103_cov62-Isochrysis_galbana.AAC.1
MAPARGETSRSEAAGRGHVSVGKSQKHGGAAAQARSEAAAQWAVAAAAALAGTLAEGEAKHAWSRLR